MSNIIKASSYKETSQKKEIKILKQTKVNPKVNEKTTEPVEAEQRDETLLQAKKEAAEIIKRAHQKAETILTKTKQECDQLKQKTDQEITERWQAYEQEKEHLQQEAFDQGRNEGLDKGFNEGQASAIQEYQQIIDDASQILQSATQMKQKIISEAEPFLVELSVDIARKILVSELKTDKEKIIGIVNEALSRIRRSGVITISVDPEYHSILMANRERLVRLLDAHSELLIVPDYRMEKAGCLIQTEMGSLDAQIDTQLQEVKKALLQVARGSEKNGSTSDQHVSESIK